MCLNYKFRFHFSVFVWFSWNTQHFYVILQISRFMLKIWATGWQTFQLMGTFYYNTNMWFTNLSHYNFRVHKFVTLVVWIVLYTVTNWWTLTGEDDNQTLLNSAFGEVYIPCFLTIFRGRVLILLWFCGKSEYKKWNFTWDTVCSLKVTCWSILQYPVLSKFLVSVFFCVLYFSLIDYNSPLPIIGNVWPTCMIGERSESA